jgi:MOSC domain-containing protein YiiM
MNEWRRYELEESVSKDHGGYKQDLCAISVVEYVEMELETPHQDI